MTKKTLYEIGAEMFPEEHKPRKISPLQAAMEHEERMRAVRQVAAVREALAAYERDEFDGRYEADDFASAVREALEAK